MTNTDKILAEFDERMVRLNKAKITRHISDRHIFQWNDKKTPSHGDQYEDSEYGYLDEMLRTLFSDSITQALAEEKERVRGIVKRTIGINTTTRFDEVVYKNGIDVKEYINKYDFLSSLDKLTDK